MQRGSYLKKCVWRLCGICCLVLCSPKIGRSQCDGLLVDHFSGTATVGCTDVTISSDGSVGFIFACGYGPYWIGPAATGSYTFTFSPAVSGVKISLGAMNSNAPLLEEVSFEVNGAFYPITNPGVDDGCELPAEITPGGRVRATLGNLGSWQDVVITENINSLKIENIYLSGAPAGTAVELRICCPTCITDAGQIMASPLDICLTEQTDFPEATQTELDGDDLLEYILFSNPLQPLGSILETSNAPQFNFNPSTMQVNQTYYVAAMAGNGLNGAVDISDDCLDISESVSVVWRPLPTVAFAIDNTNICAGSCSTVTATFSGTAPFNLMYDLPGIEHNNLTSQGSVTSFLVCIPADASPGNLTLQALSISDGNCICE